MIKLIFITILMLIICLFLIYDYNCHYSYKKSRENIQNKDIITPADKTIEKI